jgi:quercetin dioxygenase-like cupin family protein
MWRVPARAGAGSFGAMARPGDALVDPSGVRLVFVETASSSGGAAISLDWTVPPGGRLVAVPHVHPFDVEVFEIRSGRARYRVGRNVYEREAPHTYGVPPGAVHVHAANGGDGDLHIRQTVRPDPPNRALVEGVERYFETMVALAQEERVLSNGLIVDPLQSAVTLGELLLPFSYLPWLPHGAQRALIGRLGAIARGRGYVAHVEPRWLARGTAPEPGPTVGVA